MRERLRALSLRLLELGARLRARLPGRRVLIGLAIGALSITSVLLIGLLVRAELHLLFNHNLILLLSTLNLVLFAVVFFVLGRTLVKLYLERSRNVLGSRFKTKMVVLSTSLVLMPTFLMFLTATGFLNAVVDRWFDLPMKSMVASGQKLVDAYEAGERVRTRGFARATAAAIEKDGLIAKRGRAGLKALVEAKQKEYGLDLLAVFDGSGRAIAAAREADAAGGKRVEIPEKAVLEVARGEREQLQHQVTLGRRLAVLIGIPVRVSSGAGRAVVVAGSTVDHEPTALLSQMSKTYEDYKQVEVGKQNIKRWFILMLMFFTIVILFSAVWVGTALAKGVTVPIQRLAEGTRAIAEGRFDHRVDSDVPDELGILIGSFNRMTEELSQGKNKLERSNIELRKINAELESRRRYIETILQNTPSGVLSLDPLGRVTNINKAALQLFGLEERSYAAVHFRELLSTKDFVEFRVLIAKVLDVPDVSLTRDIRLRLGPRQVDLRVSFSAFHDSEGRYVGLLLVLEDLSQLIKTQKVEAWRMVAKQIAHEFKNPLTPIRMSAERIRKRLEDVELETAELVTSCCDVITQEVDGLKALVNAFSRFAQMPAVNPVSSELDKIIQNVVTLYDGVHPGVVIDRAVAPDIPTLQLDPEPFKRVLTNLIDNAVDCMDGLGRITIKARYQERSRTVIVEVADEGPGIRPENRTKLFIPHFSTKASGRGLGLAIVHRIVSDHNGSIRVEDNQPRGARFVLELPA